MEKTKTRKSTIKEQNGKKTRKKSTEHEDLLCEYQRHRINKGNS